MTQCTASVRWSHFRYVFVYPILFAPRCVCVCVLCVCVCVCVCVCMCGGGSVCLVPGCDSEQNELF